MPRVRSRVYLGRLSYRASQRDVERFFKGFGDIVDIQLKNGYGFVDFADPRDAEDAVYEKNGRDLCGERVIVELARGTPHGRDLERDRGHRRRRRSSSRSRSRSPRRRSRSRSPRRSSRRSRSRSRSRSRTRSRSRSPSVKRNNDPGEVRSNWRLDVENLSSKVSWKDLKEHCGKGGRVVYAEILSAGKGFVEYANEADLLDAVRSLDGSDLLGRDIHVSAAGVKDGKSRSRSKSRSHSRSASRSRSRSASRSRSRSRSHSRSRSASPEAKTNGNGNGNGNWNGNSNEGDESTGN